MRLDEVGARVRDSVLGRQFHAGDDGGDYATMLVKAGRCNATKLLSARGMVGGREKHSPFPAMTLKDASPGSAVPHLGTQIPERRPLLTTSPICASRELSTSSPGSSFLPVFLLCLRCLSPGSPTRPHRVGARSPYPVPGLQLHRVQQRAAPLPLPLLSQSGTQ